MSIFEIDITFGDNFLVFLIRSPEDIKLLASRLREYQLIEVDCEYDKDNKIVKIEPQWLNVDWNKVLYYEVKHVL